MVEKNERQHPAWVGLFVECYEKATKPSVAQAYEVFANDARVLGMVGDGVFDMPSLAEVRRYAFFNA